MNKKTKKMLKKLLPVLVVAVLYLVLQLLPDAKPPVTVSEGELQVHYIDVGQGDSILIRQGDAAMLVDAGPNAAGQTVVDYLREQGVKTLTYAVGTHPHEDHIGGLDMVLRAFPTENLLMPEIQANTATFEDVLDAAIDRDLRITAPRQNETFSLGTAAVTFLQCLETDDYNNASLIFRLDFGERSFLFTGDAETEAEQAVLQSRVPLDCDVLKVGHHGSVTSTSPAFLAAVSPTHAVISCATGNDYGHPHLEIRDALSKAGITVLRTDLHGSVVATTDGTTLTWNVEPGVNGGEMFVLNKSSGLFHVPACDGAEKVSEKNKEIRVTTRQALLGEGYSPCSTCRP